MPDDAGLIGSVVSNADFVGMTYALKTIGAFAKDGWAAVLPEIHLLINGVVKLSLTMTFMVWLFSPRPDVIAEFLWVVVKLNFVLWIMNNFWSITDAIFKGMVGMGVATAPEIGGLATTEILSDPSRVANLGMIAVTPLIKHIDTMLGPVDVFWYATELIFAYGALIACLATFLVFGLLVFLAAAEFYIMAIPAGFMAPFIAWNKTAFIASPAMAYVTNTGIRLFGTTVVIVMGLSIMLAMKWPKEPSMQDSVNLLILAIALLGAGLSVFKKLTGLVNGGPVSDVGGALSAMFYAARLGSAAGKEVSEVAGGIRSAKGPLPRALSGFVNGVRGGPSGGSPSSGRGPSAGPGGGAANANHPNGVRGAFQRGMAGARAAVSGTTASPMSNRITRAQGNTQMSGGGHVGSASPAPAYAYSQAPGVALPSMGSSATPGHAKAAPAPSSGFLSTYKQDMRDLQSRYDAMAQDPAVGPAVADSLRSIANRDKAMETADVIGITNPAKGQAMLGEIARIDGRVQRAVAAGRPPDVINRKSAAEYRDVVLNA